MSKVSFSVSPDNLIPKGRTEQLPQFMTNRKSQGTNAPL
jgi:hypothetical protein